MTCAPPSSRRDPQAPNGGASSGHRFWLIPTPLTRRLAETAPEWGYNYSSAHYNLSSAHGLLHFQHTHASAFQHVVIRMLSRHPACTNDSSAAASLCIVAAPLHGECPATGWDTMCPYGRLVVVDVLDADLRAARPRTEREALAGSRTLCRTLWNCNASARLIRITANQPSDLWQRFDCGYARRGTLAIPYISRARSGRCESGTPPPTESSSQRPWAHDRRIYRVALAVGFSHTQGERLLDAQRIRRELEAACRVEWRTSAAKCARDQAQLHSQFHLAPCPAGCRMLLPIGFGANMPAIAALYSQATFCLQPVGDTIARSAIIDAMAAGCIPVFFHRAQTRLWPWHWNASSASVFIDWSRGMTNVTNRSGRAVLQHLHSIPAERVRRLQAGVASFVGRLTYRGESDEQNTCRSAGERDAIDVLVEGLLGDRTVPASH